MKSGGVVFFGEGGVFSVAVLVVFMAFVSRVLLGVGVELDVVLFDRFGCLGCVDEDVVFG